MNGLARNLALSSNSLLLSLLSGLLLFLSFPKYGSGIVAWAALIPLFFALRTANPREGFMHGFLTGLVAHVGILYWIAYVIREYGYLPLYVGIAGMFLLAAYLSLYTSIFAATVVFLRDKGVPSSISAPCVWTILEFLRSHLLSGFPWENLAYSQYLYPQVIQIADLTGTYGVTFVIVAINSLLSDMMMARREQKLWTDAIAACVIVTVTLTYGYYRGKEIASLLGTAPNLNVALIQGNIDQNIKWNVQYQFQTMDIYRSLSLLSSLKEGGLIVWPETAAPFYFQRDGAMHEIPVDIARKTRSALLFGSPSFGEDGSIYYRNSAYLLNGDGTLSGRYDKVHLVPYGEYVPLRSLFPFMGKIVAGVGDFKPGDGFHPLSAGGRRIGVLICYEGIFPEAARAYKLGKADLLVNITNDAWFGRTSAPYQHFSMTVFRAVENRLYLVRSANTGISAFIDPRGEIISLTPIFERTILKGSVKVIDEMTFYAAYGDIFVYGCAVVLLMLILYGSRKQRRTMHA